MWLMLQQDQPDDYVIGTGVSHSVAEFVELAFRSAKLDDWREFVVVDSALLRPAEVDHLIADARRAQTKLGWKVKVSFSDLVSMMVDHELYRFKKGLPNYSALAANSL